MYEISLLAVLTALVLGLYRYTKIQVRKTNTVLAKVSESLKRNRTETSAELKKLNAGLKRLDVKLQVLHGLEPRLAGLQGDCSGLHAAVSASRDDITRLAHLGGLQDSLRQALALQTSFVTTWFLQKKIAVFRVTIPNRIGHFAGEPDLWAKERLLQGRDVRNCAFIADVDTVANPHMLAYWADFFGLTMPSAVWEQLATAVPALRSLEERREDFFFGMDVPATCYPIYTAWGSRPPLLTLREDDRQHVRSVLREWGMTNQDWFACVHVRERGYAAIDDDVHDYRNAAIAAFIPAMQEIVARGGWVIRMGDPTMTPLPKLDHVIDYVHSPRRSPRLDIALCAAARFFLGSNSGLYIVSTVFGVPVATANLAPICMQALTHQDLGTPKLYYSEKEQRLLTFHEALTSRAANFRSSAQFAAEGLRPMENSPDEIVGLTQEMLDRLEGRASSLGTEDEKLQATFADLFDHDLGHYGAVTSARTGAHFLRKHRDLLEHAPGS